MFREECVMLRALYVWAAVVGRGLMEDDGRVWDIKHTPTHTTNTVLCSVFRENEYVRRGSRYAVDGCPVSMLFVLISLYLSLPLSFCGGGSSI